jgi:hypothetical protein
MIESIPQNSPKHPIVDDRLNSNCLTDKQFAAVDMLAMGKSLSFVTETLKIDRKTLYHWRQDEDFQQALSDRRRELWASATDRLRGMLDRSLDVMEQQLHARFEPTQFRAAATCLRLAGMQKGLAARED